MEDSLRWPLKQSCTGWHISQPFGSHAVDYSAWGLDRHPGVDIAGPEGTPLLAPISGTLSYNYQPAGFGAYARFTKGNGMTVYLAHLIPENFPTGAMPVNAGDQIGKIGLSGNTTGYHVHFEVRWAKYGIAELKWAYNPIPFLEDYPLTDQAKIIPQWERVASWGQQFLEDSNCAVVKLIQPDKQTYILPSRTRPILRYWWDDGHPANTLYHKGEAGGKEMWNSYVKPRFFATPGHEKHLCVESWNEPDTSSVEACKRLSDAEHAFEIAAHLDGVLVATGCWGQGQPGGEEEERAARVAAMPGCFSGAYWGPHAYYIHRTLDQWHAFRHQMNMRYARDAGIAIPSTYIGESGIDLGTMGGSGGWQAQQIAATEFMHEYIHSFLYEVVKTPEIVGVSPFLMAPSWPQWSSFQWTQDMTESVGHLTLAYIPAPGTPQPPSYPVEPPEEPPAPPTPTPPNGDVDPTTYILSQIEEVRRIAYEMVEVRYVKNNALDRYARQLNADCDKSRVGRLLGWTWAPMEDGHVIIIHAYQHFIMAALPDHYQEKDIVVVRY